MVKHLEPNVGCDSADNSKPKTVAGRIADILEVVLLIAAGGAFVIISALIVGQVFFRYVLAAPPVWTEELTRYVFVWLAWLSVAVVFRNGEHIAIDAISSLVPKRLRKIHDIIIRLICVGILIFILRYGVAVLQYTTSLSAALQIDMRFVYASAPVASSVMLAFVALDAIDKHLRQRVGRVN